MNEVPPLELSTEAPPTRHLILPHQCRGEGTGLRNDTFESGLGSLTHLCCDLMPSPALPGTLISSPAKQSSKRNLPPGCTGIQRRGAHGSS